MSDAASITPARNNAAEQPRDGDSLHSNEAEEYYEKPPQKKRFYRQKKYWIICGIISTIVTLVVILLIIFVFFPMIAQLIINKSSISVNSASIAFTPPTDGTEVTKRQEPAPFVANGNDTFYMKVMFKALCWVLRFGMITDLYFLLIFLSLIDGCHFG